MLIKVENIADSLGTSSALGRCCELVCACVDEVIEIENYVTPEIMLEISIKSNLLTEPACVAFLDAALASLNLKS